MSRKSVLIAQLAEDEAIKDAFRQFAARIVNTSKLSSFPLQDYMQSALSSGSEGEEEDSGSGEELCACKCQRAKHKATVKEITDSEEDFHIDVNHKKESEKCVQLDQTLLDCVLNNKLNINTQSSDSEKMLNNNNSNISNNSNDSNNSNNNNNHCESCECISCERIKKCNENAIKLIADEERKKRRNERKKVQKKKKKDKKKAEKLNNGSDNVVKSDNKESISINANNESKVNGKTDNNNNKNNNKNETKKKKTNSENSKQNLKQNVVNKEVEKPIAKPLAPNREPEKMSSNKSSPKSERENEVVVSDAEEEELSFSSAYVSQIAQRKSKPSKSAQPLTDTQDCIQMDDNMKSGSNNYNEIYNYYDYSNSSNSNNSSNNSNSNNNININEELPKTKTNVEKKQKSSKVPKENKLQNIDKSIELAILANQKAEALKFNEAIDLFSQALAYNPTDYRFYVNRSYCYDSIQDFRSALKDAEIAIQLRSDWPKCHYRKGKALAGLKNYHEAEVALKKVITIEKDCDEALTELFHVRYGAIIDMGYDSSAANTFASKYDSIKDALDALSIRGNKSLKSTNSNKITNLNNYQMPKKAINSPWNSSLISMRNGFSSVNTFDGKTDEIWEDDDIYISDDEYNAFRDIDFNSKETSPTNPFGWKALWVGNVSLNAKLETVTTMFRKFGNLNYCNIFKGNNGGNFILVHYDNPESPTQAMTKYQGQVIPGVSISNTGLTIRFRPNKDQKKPNYDQRLESDECYYWRTTGCARGEKCLYKHIFANKGVDKQAWMCNPLKKGLPLNGKQLK